MLRFVLSAAVAVGLWTGGQAVAPTIASACPGGDYTNSNGNCVQDPTAPTPGQTSPPAGATALCRDGDYSFSQHHAGTCSGHHGVAQWLTGN